MLGEGCRAVRRIRPTEPAVVVPPAGFVIEREEKWGGRKAYSEYQALEDDFANEVSGTSPFINFIDWRSTGARAWEFFFLFFFFCRLFMHKVFLSGMGFLVFIAQNCCHVFILLSFI